MIRGTFRQSSYASSLIAGMGGGHREISSSLWVRGLGYSFSARLFPFPQGKGLGVRLPAPGVRPNLHTPSGADAPSASGSRCGPVRYIKRPPPEGRSRIPRPTLAIVYTVL